MERKRPGGVLAVALLAIGLGSLGGCVGLWSLAGAAMQGRLQETQQRILEQGAAANPQLQAQLDAQRELQEVTSAWMPFTVTHQALNLIASTVLLVVGILLLRWHPLAPMAFLVAGAANAVVDLAGAVLGVLVQRDTSEVMRRMMSSAAATDPASAQEMGRMFDGIMQASAWVSMCFAGGWVLLKLVYYGWGAVYLRRPDPRRLFEAAPPSPNRAEAA